MLDLDSQNTRLSTDSALGFSILELIIVLLVIVILAVFAVRFTNPTLYYADQQAQTVINALKEARQRSITQKETIRVEINADERTVRLIDENDAGDATDDVEITTKVIGNSSNVIFDKAPDNANSTPNEPTPTPPLVFKPSLHPSSLSKNVATLRFHKTGKVLNEGTNASGDGAVTTGATIYFWTPADNSGSNSNSNQSASLVRAITILGSSGTHRYWKCPIVDDQCSDWVK